MEPMNALADVQGDRCEIWTGTQNPLGFRYEIADALELDVANVAVNNFYMGGGNESPNGALFGITGEAKKSEGVVFGIPFTKYYFPIGTTVNLTIPNSGNATG